MSKPKPLQGKALAEAMMADKHFRESIERGLADFETGRVSKAPRRWYATKKGAKTK